MMFPTMSVEQLVERRRELLTDMSTEYVPDTRRMICGAVLKLDAELLEGWQQPQPVQVKSVYTSPR